MSTLRGTRRFAIGFFLIYAAAVIYPGVTLFRGPRPFVLGMPFAMAWTAAWVVAAFFILLRLDRVYSNAERAHAGRSGYPDAIGGREEAERAQGQAGRDPAQAEGESEAGPGAEH